MNATIKMFQAWVLKICVCSVNWYSCILTYTVACDIVQSMLTFCKHRNWCLTKVYWNPRCTVWHATLALREHLYLYLPLGLLCWSPWPWQHSIQYNSLSLWTSTIITQHWTHHQSLVKLKWKILGKMLTFGSTTLFNVQDTKARVWSWMIHSDCNTAHSAGKTYNAMVNETMFPGDAVCLLLPSNYLDCPSVGVDLLCSITPSLLCFQEDKEDCP